MKRSVALVPLLVAFWLLAPTASASPARIAAPTATFNATITGPAAVTLGCCHHSITFTSVEAVVPRLGRVVVSGTVRHCGSPCARVGDPEAGTRLSLVFTTPSGDTLMLGGFRPFLSEGPLTWTVVGGTGRFSDASGSGEYDYIWHDTDPRTATIWLWGTFRLRG